MKLNFEINYEINVVDFKFQILKGTKTRKGNRQKP